jgi:hypothetical protein
MLMNRPFLFTAACAAALPFAACGDGDGAEIVVATGAHHGYVVATAQVPTNDAQVREFGLDLGSKTTAKLDGKIDNALGTALSTLAALNFDIQGTIKTAVDQGSLLLLLDFQTDDFATSSGAGLSIKIGANPMPPACNGSGDTTCRRHLSGAGTFTIASDSPQDLALTGKIAGGTFNGGPGDATLAIAIGSPTPIKLDLLHARATLSGISDTGIMSAVVGGLVTQAQLNNEIGPAIKVSVDALLLRDCPPTGAPPTCGCSGTGLTVITALDTNADCKVSVEELLGFSLVKQVLQPDSCSKDTCTEADSLSVGVKITAVKGNFPL